ncbi:hypothetical protein [Streptomyces sp. NA02536]|uniref:hypothetical protein n=1 Tax=Streptomyces sp. NA02536 TaxID=2742133 RepID=UPI0015915364|nr:hypothetical protein [Streptomyces sp. NA02536]QKW03253.1 hypothetical protein HUT14_26985 [Streptomyces sp. NA02536]
MLMRFDTHLVDPGHYVFDVGFWIVPLSYCEFLKRQYAEPPAPDARGSLATCSVMPPAEVATGG